MTSRMSDEQQTLPIQSTVKMNGLHLPLTASVWQIGSQDGSLKLHRFPQCEETNEKFQQWQKSVGAGGKIGREVI